MENAFEYLFATLVIFYATWALTAAVADLLAEYSSHD